MVPKHIFHLHFSATCHTTGCTTCIQPVAQPEANKENIPDDQHGSDDNDEDEIESEAENEDGDDESLVGTEDEEGLDLEGVFVEVPGKFK